MDVEAEHDLDKAKEFIFSNVEEKKSFIFINEQLVFISLRANTWINSVFNEVNMLIIWYLFALPLSVCLVGSTIPHHCIYPITKKSFSMSSFGVMKLFVVFSYY